MGRNRTTSTIVLAAILIGVLSACTSPRQPEPVLTATVGIAPGDDWSLPSWVKVSANAGIYLSGVSDHIPTAVPIQQIALLQASWKELEPAPGQYDWSSIDNQITTNPSRRFWLRIASSRVADCPSWLPWKYLGLQSRFWFYGSAPQRFYYLWDAPVDKEFRAFLDAFRRHYAVDHPNLLAHIKFEYLPGAWNYGEYQVWPDDRPNGITPRAYIAWFNRLINAYKASLGGDGRKLVYTGTGHMEWANGNTAWRQAVNTVAGGNVHADYIIGNSGGGAREGETEAFNLFGNEPSWGQTTQMVNGVKYVVTNDNSPLIAATDRYFGTENECYGDCGAPNTLDYYNVKMSFLLMLKLRMNWIFTCYRCYRTAPAVLDWAFREMGKHYDDAPDAWADLRQWTDKNDGQTLNNWERWLYQRDQPGDGMTVPTDPTTSPWVLQGPPYDEARRTDHAGGSDYMYFAVDNKFLYGGRDRVQLKVTYLDNNKAAWRVEYDAADGDAYKPTMMVRNVGDGQWKTATFTIPDAAFQNRQQGGMDFRIYDGGRRDLTVRFVRIVKTVPPRATPAAAARR
jgi:hypothetical protein